MGRSAHFGRPTGLFWHGDPSNGQAPSAAALEQLVCVDLVRPGEEVRLGVVVRRAVYGRAVGRRRLGLDRLAALERVDPRLRLLGDGALFVTARHGAECTLGACPPRSPFTASPSATERSRRWAASISR